MDIRQFAYAGIDVYGILQEATGKTTDEIKKMDVTYEELAKALQMASQEGGKYYKGQENAVDTLNGKVNTLKKTFQELLGEIAESLMPTIKKLTDKLQDIVNWFKSLDKGTKERIAKIGAIVTALSPVLIILGKLIKTGGTVFSLLSKLTGGIGKVITSAGGLSGVLSALASPVGIIITAIGVLAGAFIHLYQTNDTFREKVNQTFGSIVQTLQTSVMPVIEQIVDIVETVLGTVWEIIQELWATIEPFVQKMFEMLMDFWNNFGKDFVEKVSVVVSWLLEKVAWIMENIILPIRQTLFELLIPAIQSAFERITSRVQTFFEFISNIWGNIKGVFEGIIDFIKGVFTGNWEQAWEGVKNIFSNIIQGLGEIFKLPINLIIDGINSFIEGVNQIHIPDEVPVVGGIGFNSGLHHGGIRRQPSSFFGFL